MKLDATWMLGLEKIWVCLIKQVNVLTARKQQKTAVKDQWLFFDHVSSFEDFSTLNYEPKPFKLVIKESL